MFVATNGGIYAVSIEKLLAGGELPKAPLPHVIPIKEVVSLSRFHDTLYALTVALGQSTDPFSTKSTAVEIFLYDPTLTKWNSKDTEDNQLYEINQQVPFTS